MTRIAIDDRNVHSLASVLADEGHEARLVGGAVRDIVVGSRPKDMDIATDALPQRVMEIAGAAGYRTIPTGLQHGTVTVVADGAPYEITTLRRDVQTDGRHAEVEYVGDFREDASRRDFTFNAMSASMDGVVHDYFGGVGDLEARRVRFVGRAEDRIAEDYLRILRFFRFRARFGGSETQDDFAAIRNGRSGLKAISAERVWSEMARILIHPRGHLQITAMSGLGVADVIGLHLRPEAIPLCAAVAAAGGRPGTALGALLGTASGVNAIARHWKLSNYDADDAAVAADVLADHSDSPDHWIGRATDGLDPSRAIPVLAATGRKAAAEALHRPLPAFPLRGKDFLDAGCEPGPSIGTMISAAREEWKASGFSASRAELLEAVLPPASRRRP